MTNLKFETTTEMYEFLAHGGMEKWSFLYETDPWSFKRMTIVDTQMMTGINEDGKVYRIERMERRRIFVNSTLPVMIWDGEFLGEVK